LGDVIKNIDSISRVAKKSQKPEKSNEMEAFNLVKEKKKSAWTKELSLYSKNKKTEKPSKSKEIKKTKAHNTSFLRLVGTMMVVVFAIILFTASGVYAYKNQYDNKAYFGTRLLGEDVGGRDFKSIERIIGQKVSQIEFSFIVDNQIFVAKPADTGLSFKASESARKAIARGKKGDFVSDWSYAAASMLYRITPSVFADGAEKYFMENVQIEHEIDKEKLAKFTENLSIKFNTESQNANLIISGTDVQVVPAIYGRKIVADSIAQQINEGIRSAESPKINIEFERVNPSILEKDTADSIAAANKIINTPVKFTYKDKTYTPDKKTIAGWIVFRQQDNGGKVLLVPTVDSVQVSKYIYGAGKDINIPAVNRKITIKNGGEQTVDQEGKDGLSVDHNRAGSQAAASLNAGQAISMEIPTYAVAAKTQVNNILVADWAKYIEVNLSTQRMCAYLAGGIQQNCWAITSGASSKGYATPTGTFLISRKSGEGGAPGSGGGGVCMPNPPSSTPLCGINYVSTFTPQGHAIHEAWWRSSFGGQDYKWNGSHGCVNATYDIAKWIYYWAPIGTPVVIHY
jgi:lipoprotein-anchoring transpeptidase ErfK/SrfK